MDLEAWSSRPGGREGPVSYRVLRRGSDSYDLIWLSPLRRNREFKRMCKRDAGLIPEAILP